MTKKELIVGCLIFFGFVASMMLLALAIDSSSCTDIAVNSHKQTRYDMPVGCYIEIKPGEYIPVSVWRNEE